MQAQEGQYRVGLALRRQPAVSLALGEDLSLLERREHRLTVSLMVPGRKYAVGAEEGGSVVVYSLGKGRVVQRLSLGQEQALLLGQLAQDQFLLATPTRLVTLDLARLRGK